MTHTIRLTKSGHNPQTKTHTHTCTHLEANRQTDKQIGPPTHTHTQTNMHACTRTHLALNALQYIDMQGSKLTYTASHSGPFVWTFKFNPYCMCKHTYIHINIHMHTYIHTYVYIYMYLQCQNYQLRIRFADETHGLILPEAPGCTGWQKFFGLCLITEKTMRTV